MKKFLLVLLAFSFLGCSAMSHLNEILTLKAIGDDQALNDKEVIRKDKKFKALVEVVQSGKIKDYPNKVKVFATFGEPIMAKEIKKPEGDVTLWMYRYAAKYFDSDKVNLYFDQQGQLIQSEFVEGKKKPTETSPNKS